MATAKNSIIERLLFLTFILGLAIGNRVTAQEKKDSVRKETLARKALGEGIKLISTSAGDTIINEKSVDTYLPYTGKIIRNIDVQRIGFDKSIYDSAKNVQKAVTKIANALHVDTRARTIRQHLFLLRNQPLSPYKLADNERYLRDRDFILDSRIVVTPVEGTDSVDLIVFTRDVFSIGGTVGGSIPNAPKITVYDANVLGQGQRVEFTTLLDGSRMPFVGYSLLYRKSSLLGSLADLELGYTQLNSGSSYGDETEFAWLARIKRPLVSPYMRLAGGLELSSNHSVNVYNEPDSTFLRYKYDIFDSWLGYNIGIRKTVTDRNRQFLAFRYFNGYFQDQPDQPEYGEEVKYNNINGYLSEFTFYRQNFYKTRYVLGFGRTEDVPYGFTAGATAGYVRLVHLKRPYAAVKLNYANASRKGNFYKLQLETGGFYRNDDLEDVTLKVGAAYFSRLLQVNRFKIRGLLSANYSQIFNQQVIDWLRINKTEIPGFRSDSVTAASRLAFHAESWVYTPGSLFGFRFAPFAAIDLVLVDCIYCVTNANSYTGLSAGLRTRNENLIFGTLEAKVTYIPHDQYGKSKFVFNFRQNLRIKNTGTFVKAPSLITSN